MALDQARPIRALAALSPRNSTPASMRAVAPFLEGDPRTLAAAADGVGVVVGLCLGAVAIGLGRPSLLVAAVGVGSGATVLARGGVLAVANARQSRTLGTAPTIVSRAVLRMRIAPAAEEAAAFAAGTEGRLGSRLADHVGRARGTPASGLGAFAEAWRGRFPALYRSLTLVEAAADAPEGERDRALGRAMETILDGTRDRATEAADSLRGPSTAMYAFGVLLPLALVSVLPAAGAAGVEATLPAIVGVYDFVLPAGLLCGSGWLLANRPVAFPPAPIDSEVASSPAVYVAAGVGSGLVGAVAARTLLPRWTVALTAVGVGVGSALVVRYRPVVAVRKRTDELESGLSDALYLVGRRVSDGIAVEQAVADAAGELEGIVGGAFRSAARRQRQLRVGVEAAFVGEHGALEDLPSQRAESTARLLGMAAGTGAPAGRALVETADHLDELRRVERDAKQDLGRVTSTLSNTAAFFGPLVGGATVALADSVGTTEALNGSAPETAGLGIAVGVYVFLMAAVLTGLSTGLQRGLDRATVGYRVGIALCTATVTFLLAVFATSAVSGGL
ncbi:type IV pilus biogenesis complex membrane subunit [Natronomonas moolapensis 8.8.11]|uniref:Type IV pilus biogenesis complex membrane subunit n=1 Tax=Natronomonas moolapensis (strain DSM 18674 / CECT 7526 / JCM 14361 / 8.8.11) TaxID=268739 RepID=M1XPU2_NATM8|nr:type II/IV secretion system protein [Natronomonas moolapensis]CCQ36089.1 type IV pilus biogenesis complex membrane subunit [Natronomonas moolapensis 8.8.11]